jgi:hypothetical protein
VKEMMTCDVERVQKEQMLREAGYNC